MKQSCRLRIISAVLSFITVLSIVSSFPVFGTVFSNDDGNVSGGAVLSEYLKNETNIAGAEDWIALSGSNSVVISNTNGKAMKVYSSTSSVGAEIVFPNEIEIGDNKEIGINICSLSGMECTIVLTVQHDKGNSTVTDKIITGDEYYVFTVIPDNAKNIKSISFTASIPNSENGTDASVMVQNAVVTKQDHSAIIEKYSAFSVADMTSADSSKVWTYAGPIVLSESGDSFAIRITLDGIGGGITVHYSSDGKSFAVCGSTVITEGRSSYLFHVGEVTSASAYRLEFTGTDYTEIDLKKVEFIPVKRPSSYTSLGSISKCSVSDNILTVTGSITRDAAVNYIDGNVCLYEIPLWMDTAEALSGDAVATISMSTSFSFTNHLSKEHSAFTSYIVAIRDKNGVYPLSDPIFPAGNALPEIRSNVGTVYGISPEEAFAAGFDNFVIDVDISSFFLEKSTHSSTVFTHDGHSYYPNRSITSALDLKTQFLFAAGMGVTFRIISDSDGTLNIKDEQKCRTFAAAIAYLTDKYSPYGFILHDIFESEDASSVSDRAFTATSLIRMASVSADSSVIYVPIDNYGETQTLVWLLAEYMSDLPKLNWELLLNDIPLDGSDSGAINACAVDGGYTSQITVSAKVPGNKVNSVMQSIVGEAGRSYLIDISDGNTPEVESDSWDRHFVTYEWDGNDDNTVTLWDFTTSYDSGGFTVPAGPTGILTENNEALEEYTGIPVCRALMTVLGEGSEVIIAQPSSPMKLTSSPFVRFLFSCKTTSPFSLDIVFISGNKRAVFTAEYNESGVYAPVCDLSGTEIADKVERIAIILGNGDNVELGIACVTASGMGNAADMNETVFITEPTITTTAPVIIETPADDSISEVYIAVGALIVVTIIVFAALSLKRE